MEHKEKKLRHAIKAGKETRMCKIQNYSSLKDWSSQGSWVPVVLLDARLENRAGPAGSSGLLRSKVRCKASATPEPARESVFSDHLSGPGRGSPGTELSRLSLPVQGMALPALLDPDPSSSRPVL